MLESKMTMKIGFRIKHYKIIQILSIHLLNSSKNVVIERCYYNLYLKKCSQLFPQ